MLAYLILSVKLPGEDTHRRKWLYGGYFIVAYLCDPTVLAYYRKYLSNPLTMVINRVIHIIHREERSEF